MSLVRKATAPNQHDSIFTTPSRDAQNGLQIVALHQETALLGRSPLSSSFTQKLRPFLDVVDRLRSLGVSEEGITLPTIVVVGDQSSGKSSVLESLSGVELPKGQGIVTRVPLVLRLKGTHATSPDPHAPPKITLSYQRKENVEISEKDIPAAISNATIELAGPGKAIVNRPITLNVCRPGAPDLTLVDLPGITRVPVHGQPDNIFDKIKDLIMHYIRPEETIILNVLNAAMDFSVCESIRMSRQVDKLGKRTLAVVTKVDLCPDGLLQKITDDAVKIGLGYICVRNRTKEASFEEAQDAEERLFSSHAELKKLCKSMVGVEALAHRLVQLQTQTIADVLPTVLKQIDSSLEVKRQELQLLSGDICNPVDASVAFLNVSCAVKKALEDILLSGSDCSADITTSTAVSTTGNGSTHSESQTNYNASLHQEFAKFTQKVTTDIGIKLVCPETQGGHLDFIQRLLSECLGTNLPNVVPQAIIEKMVRKLLDSISSTCASEMPSFVHDAARKVAFSVVAKHAGRFPNLKKLYISAFQRSLSDGKNNCFDAVMRLLKMEKAVVYTTSAELYNTLVAKLMQAASGNSHLYSGSSRNYTANVEGLVALDMAALGKVSQEAPRQAACSILAYWIILSRRLADQVCHELRYSFNEVLLKVSDDVLAEVVRSSGDLSTILEEVMAEQPEVAHDRCRLRSTIDMLSKSKELVSQVLGAASFDY